MEDTLTGRSLFRVTWHTGVPGPGSCRAPDHIHPAVTSRVVTRLAVIVRPAPPPHWRALARHLSAGDGRATGLWAARPRLTGVATHPRVRRARSEDRKGQACSGVATHLRVRRARLEDRKGQACSGVATHLRVRRAGGARGWIDIRIAGRAGGWRSANRRMRRVIDRPGSRMRDAGGACLACAAGWCPLPPTTGFCPVVSS